MSLSCEDIDDFHKLFQRWVQSAAELSMAEASGETGQLALARLVIERRDRLLEYLQLPGFVDELCKIARGASPLPNRA